MTSTDGPFETLAIVGFGLIGASIAKAGKARGLVRHVVAIDRPVVLDSAALAGLADDVVDTDDAQAVTAVVSRADLVVLSAPVRVIEERVEDIARAASCATDCGSTKRSIARAAARAGSSRFVPGHPMAGDPRGGAEYARADLFEGRSWILCPDDVEPATLSRVEAFVTGLGSRAVRMTPEAHDRAVALTSHVPQLLASVLTTLAEERSAAGAAGPAFASATRVAGGSEAMWKDILATNADEIALALRDVSAELIGLGEALAQNPPDLQAALHALERARQSKRS